MVHAAKAVAFAKRILNFCHFSSHLCSKVAQKILFVNISKQRSRKTQTSGEEGESSLIFNKVGEKLQKTSFLVQFDIFQKLSVRRGLLPVSMGTTETI